MTRFERLFAIATGTGDVCAKAREIAGVETLAIALLKFAYEDTTLEVSPTDVSNILKMPRSTASNCIDRIGPKISASEKSSAKAGDSCA